MDNQNQPPEQQPIVQSTQQVSPPISPKSKLPVFIIAFIILIIVGGGIYFLGIKNINQSQQAKLAPAISPTTFLPSPTTIPDETANWKTYRNNELGYSIKLPANWNASKELSVKLGTDGIEKFTSLSDTEILKIMKEDPYNPSFYFEIEVKDNKGININEWASNSKYSPQGANQRVIETLLGNISAVQVLGNQGDGYVDYYVYNNGKIYNLGYYYRENDPAWKRPSGITKEIFDQILSTFKFDQ